MRQNYRSNKLGEEVVHDFLNKNFYSLIKRNCKSTLSCEKWQKKGVDEIIDDNYYIDEKAAIEWATPKNIKKPLQTFTIELFTKNNSFGDNKGWFIDDRKLTNYYFFMWVGVDSIIKEGELRYGRFIQNRWWEKDQIDEICLYVLNREKLKYRVKQIYDENEKKFECFFDRVKHGESNKMYIDKDVTLKRSKNDMNNNDAINIKLSRNILSQISEYKGIIRSKTN